MEMNNQLKEIAFRMKEMREVCGFSVEEMAEKTDITVEQYCEYEKGTADFPFSFIHVRIFLFEFPEALPQNSFFTEFHRTNPAQINFSFVFSLGFTF